MKGYLAILAILAVVMLSGCTSFGQWSPGAQKVVDFICQPSPEQQQTAAQMLTALDAAQAVGATFYAPLGIIKASAVLTTIKDGGCFLVTELAEAFKVVDAANATVQAKQLKMLKTAPAALPEYAPLRKLVK